jgi:DNA-binding transcriptional LysR family regulator
MELRHLRYFLKVAEELSFSKAAEKLFISQPPLSRQIKELEEELGARLFNRTNKKVTLTEAGDFFLSEINPWLQSLDRINRKTNKIANNVNGVFRIAYISSTFSATISGLIQHLSQLFPYVSFKLYEVPSHKQILALEQGKLDLGILRAPLYSTKLYAKTWFTDKYALIYNKQLIQIESEEDMRSLAEQKFVFFNKEYAPQYYQTLIEICASYGFTPNVVHESNNVSSIIQLVRNGLGVSIVPSSLSKSHAADELAFKPLANSTLTTDVLLVTPKDEPSKITEAATLYLINKQKH